MKIEEVLPQPKSKVDFSVELLNNSFGPAMPNAMFYAASDFSVTIKFDAETVEGKRLVG